MIIDCISDLHGFFPKMEGGDLLIVAGDLTAKDTINCWIKFYDWLKAQDYREKIVIGGNHDHDLEDYVDEMDTLGKPFEGIATFLCDSGTTFEGLKIWGSPWTPTFPGINPKCTAFTGTEEEIYERFVKIPQDVDILVTHGPAWKELDLTLSRHSAGSTALHGWLKYVGRPKLHIFGHIHEAYGEKVCFPEMRSINCSHVDRYYQPVNEPVR